MPILQRKFKYTGDAKEASISQLNLSFSYPVFSYQIAEPSTYLVSRVVESTETVTISHDIHNHRYKLELPNKALAGNNPVSSANFRNYMQKVLAGNNINTDDIAFRIDLVFRDADTDTTLGKQSFEALYLQKTSLPTDQRAFNLSAMASAEARGGEVSGQNLMLINPPSMAPTSGGNIDAISNQTLVLVNRTVYNDIFNEFCEISGSGDEYLFFSLLRDFITLDDETHTLAKLTDAILKRLIASLTGYGLANAEQALTLIKKKFAEFFEFTIEVPEIRKLAVAGQFTIKTTDSIVVTDDDLNFYDLSLEYSLLSVAEESAFHTELLDWSTDKNQIENNTIPFMFDREQPIFLNSIDGFVSVNVKTYDGSLVWTKKYKPNDPMLQKLQIEVLLQRPNTLIDGNKKGSPNKNKKLRGKVVVLNSEIALKDVIVLVQAKKANENIWRIVSATTTDSQGNFTMPYPYGNYGAAQAIVSLTPNSPADIPVDLNNQNGQTISDDFLYLLVKDIEKPASQEAEKDEEDCSCQSQKSVPRLPDHADLIGSDEYSQDMGGTCVNLSTPNRTLREFNYHAIVRTSDPDVANYTLCKNNNGTFELVGGASKIKRAPVDLTNPIRWQDAPNFNTNVSLYQSVTVATGHILHYKSEFKADGYSMGELLYSLPLAPGQKKQIVVFDSFHELQAAETQSLAQGERISASLIDEREITDQLGGGISEALSGSSSATTSGVSAGLGIGASFGAIGGSLGVAGGYANSNSSASQNSSRNVAQHFGERLRQAIMQNAGSYRQQNASVVTTVQEGQHYSATTEVVANHNHCHPLTMLYFEVLRHYAIYQDLINVEECVFVPLLMTNFTADNIYKWRDVLARYLLPVHANTYLQPFSFINRGRAHPLLKGFDAIDRIKTNYANVDFPATTYDDEVIRFIKGDIYLRTNLQRPKIRYDRIKSLPVISKTVTHEEFDASTTTKSVLTGILTGGLSFFLGGDDTTKTVSEQVLAKEKIFDAFMQLDANYETVPPAKCIRVVNFQPVTITIFGKTITISGQDFFEDSKVDKKLWTTYASLLGYNDVLDMLEYYFKGRLISEWDDIYYNDIAPVIFQKIMESIRIENIALDLTTVGRYKGGEKIMRLTVNATTSLKRKQFPEIIKMFSNNLVLKQLHSFITLDVDKVNLYYSTPHYHGPLFAGYVGNDLLDVKDPKDPLDMGGVQLYAPENAEEKRNPKKEDAYLAEKLIEHLNSNIEHYNKALWQSLDADRRYMLLDGFNIQVFNDFGQPIGFRSLSSVVKNHLMSVVGNSLVFPVAAGYKVSKSYIAEKTEDDSIENVSLLDHYKPITPVQPYRVSVPSRGVFLEAVQGSCNACEKVEENTSQDWTKFTADEPTPISPIVAPTPQITDWKAAFKDFAPPIVNIQNAPALPAPGAGLAGLSELLGKSGVFKDITGLDSNQQNVLKTYLSNQENAKAFAEMAKDMAMQGHNTGNSDKIMSTLKSAKDNGAINQDDYSKLVKSHLQQQIDGGSAAKAEMQNTKPTLTEAAVKAADQGKTVKAQKIDPEGATESVEILGSTAEKVLAKISGNIPLLKQEKIKGCWATVATMLMSWKQGKALTVTEAMGSVGAKYLQIYNDDIGLSSSEKPAFISAINMQGEPPANYTLQQYIDWVNTYGPLWVTTDSASASGKFSPHARILTKITGTGTPDGIGTNMTFINPTTGSEVTQSFLDFIKAFEQMVTDNKSEDLFIQIVHFAATSEAGEGADEESSNVDTDARRVPSEIAAQITLYSGYAAGTTTKQVADYFKNKMAKIWTGKGGIVGMIFTTEQAKLIEYLNSSAVPADYADVATKAKDQANKNEGVLAATYPFTVDGKYYCVVQFKRESDPNLAKNYFARLAHEICHYMMQESSPLILADTRDFLFHPAITPADRVLGAKAREAFVNEVLGRRLNYLVHDEIDQVDNPGTMTHATLGKSCYEFAKTNWSAVAYYKPINDFLSLLSTEEERRTQIGIWLQTFWSKTDLFDNATLSKKIKDDFNFAGHFLKNATDAEYAAEQSRGIQ